MAGTLFNWISILSLPRSAKLWGARPMRLAGVEEYCCLSPLGSSDEVWLLASDGLLEAKRRPVAGQVWIALVAKYRFLDVLPMEFLQPIPR